MQKQDCVPKIAVQITIGRDFGRRHGGPIRWKRWRRKTLRNIGVALLIVLLPCPALAQKSTPAAPAQVAQEEREYRMDNEDRIVRELNEFIAMPNLARNPPNVQKNETHLMEMLRPRGV